MNIFLNSMIYNILLKDVVLSDKIEIICFPCGVENLNTVTIEEAMNKIIKDYIDIINNKCLNTYEIMKSFKYGYMVVFNKDNIHYTDKKIYDLEYFKDKNNLYNIIDEIALIQRLDKVIDEILINYNELEISINISKEKLEELIRDYLDRRFQTIFKKSKEFHKSDVKINDISDGKYSVIFSKKE